MSEFRILDYNYAFDATVGLTATSSDSAFPVANIRRHHRSRVWRSSGNFVIAATNKYLDFSEGGGALNAVLTTGTYTPTTLAAAIVAAMTAAGGAHTYTVTFSTTTGRWTISTSHSALSLLTLTGANTANGIGATLGFDVLVDYTGATTYTAAAIALHTEEGVTIDLRTTEDIDTFAIIFDPLLGYRLTPEAVIKLQANQTPLWTSPAVDITLAYDEDYNVITHFFSSAQTYRYWRVKIVDPKNPILAVELPKLLLGKATQLGQDPQIGFSRTRRDQSRTEETLYGHRYHDVYPNLRRFDFSYAALTEADLKTLELIFERVGSVTPVFLALDPTATTFDKDRFAIYGYLKKEWADVNEFYTYFNTPLVIEEGM